MTDTTDKDRDLKVAVDSLKHSCLRLNKYQHRATVDIEDVELVLTALEAERERADVAEIAAKSYKNIAEAGVKEIAEMKGDQVPVALVDERQGSGGFCLTQYGRRLNLQHGTELFTSPQKPVVYLKSGYLHKSEAIDAIEAAGCVVSFSDERLMQDMSGIVKDGE